MTLTTIERAPGRAEALVRRWYQPVRGYFRGLGLSLDEAKDLTQETFLRATRAADDYRGGLDEASWIFTIADNVWKNELRRRGAQKRAADTVSLESSAPGDYDEGEAWLDPPAPAAGPLDRALDRERRERLESAIATLPPRMRRCFELRFVEQMKYREIAALEQVSESTVKTQMFQARRRLRELLDDDSAFATAADSRDDFEEAM
ncbi:MAG: RNA polymerase sigma factor [Acidobacteriota bacterium]